jgi:ABC-2 type transport system ATP-binding protein
MTQIAVHGLTKRFGDVLAVDDLTFEVEAGTVTGFLGPNGAGKTTTLRMLLGLVHPTAGQALISGVPYAKLDNPVRHVGALLEASSFHPGRTARDHLRVLATAAGIRPARADQVLEEVGLSQAAGRRAGGFSLGMRQRLGLGAALLGDPPVLILDEPANGLDPEGVHWLRAFLRHRADDGGTVLVSSHLLAELALSADQVVIIKDGRLVRHASIEELTQQGAAGVRVHTPQAQELVALLASRGISAELVAAEELVAKATTAEAVGRAVAAAGIVVYEMQMEHPDLEDAFLALTAEAEGA